MMSPLLERPKFHFVTETKVGRDGFAMIYTGRWGEPLTLDCEAVFDTFVNANAAITSYRDAPSLTPVNVTWESIAFNTAYNIHFFIQAVDITEQRAAASFQRGAVIYSPGHVVMSRWTLLPRFIPS
jgi:hypothetical protein